MWTTQERYPQTHSNRRSLWLHDKKEKERTRFPTRNHLLPATGDVDEQTARAIDSAVAALVPQSQQSPTAAGAVGSQAFGVDRLHRVLTALGYRIEQPELALKERGTSTIAALRALQAQRGLPAVGEIDELTLEVLLELEQNITININDGPIQTAPQPPVSDQHRGIVQGKLVDEDGGPIASTRVALFSVQLRAETCIREASTGESGQYCFRYERPQPLNLVVRAYDAAGAVIAASATVYAAAQQIEIDITTAADGVLRTPSQFTTLVAAVTAGLDGTPLLDLKENKDTHELTFLASSIGVDFTQVAYLFIAEALGTQNGLRPETFFGLFAQGTPPALKPALANLPDAGIDDAFTAQVLSAVLVQSNTTLGNALTASVAANILPASYADSQAGELSRISALRVTAVGSAPYAGGTTPLNGLLAAGSVAANVQRAFLDAFAANGGNLEMTWKALSADQSLTEDQLTTLKTVLDLGELLSGSLPLVQDTLQRLAQKTLASPSDLALLDESDWEARIRTVDPNAASIPQGGVWTSGGVVSDPSGAQIVFPPSTNPTSSQLEPLKGINAALGLSATDISAVLAASETANALTLPTLTALLRYARLASALSLSVPDLILWIELTGGVPFGVPFGGTPADMIEFLRWLAVLQATKIAVHDLDYLLRGQSASQSALAFTVTQATAVLQAIRDAVAKVIAANQLTLTSVSSGTPITVTTAKPHGLSTGAQVFINGVQGTTAANGIFAIAQRPGYRVDPVGGIKEKVVAAHRAGIKRVMLPARNRKDFENHDSPFRNSRY
jgi:Lon protease (S16) C-terminal proteolytic domain